MGLRESRKRQTERQIRRSALELARDQSIESISVEAICESAGVSYRTFFNYFPFKESAFLVPPPDFPEDAVAMFLSGTGPLVQRLSKLMAAQAMHAPDLELIATARDVAAENPKVNALQAAAFQNFELTLAGLISAARGAIQMQLHDQVLAGAVLGAVRVILDNNDVTDRDAIGEAIETHLTILLGPRPS